MEKSIHTTNGIIAMSAGILGLFFMLLPYVTFVSVFMAFGAIAFGAAAAHKNDRLFGIIGIVLGIVTIVAILVISYLLYVSVTGF